MDYANYREVKLDGMLPDRSYKDPMTKIFQYEYALFEEISALFGGVSYRSKAIDRLRMYFYELPVGGEGRHSNDPEEVPAGKKKRTREAVREKIRNYVLRDVAGQITFPMMDACRVYMKVIENPDRTHTFIFTDEIYEFSVRLVGSKLST